ncbi:P4H3 [Scenedesmus sp. PABB004]|nr:P4H3 [Scenedesmus sp. PABB004]
MRARPGAALGALLLALAAGGGAADAAAAAAGAHGEDGLFIGWQGETYRPGGAGAPEPGRKWIETISWSPRAFVFHNFLSPAEVDHMVGLVESAVKRSEVVDTKTGRHTHDQIRTSYGASIMRGQDTVIASIEARIAEWTRLPADHGEPIQVLRYRDGQKYDAHWDWFDDPTHPATDGENRAATVLMYLGDVSEGGETALPIGRFIDAARQALPAPSERAARRGPEPGAGGGARLALRGRAADAPRRRCRAPRGAGACAANGSGLAVVPRRGDALLFWDMHVDGRAVDRSSLHASCPTLKGTKWTATKWIHNRPYGAGYDPLKQAAACDDKRNDCACARRAARRGLGAPRALRCAALPAARAPHTPARCCRRRSALAAAGRCDADPGGMLGLKGQCRRSCRDCVDCPDGDAICLRRNMRSLRGTLRDTAPSPAPS